MISYTKEDVMKVNCTIYSKLGRCYGRFIQIQFISYIYTCQVVCSVFDYIDNLLYVIIITVVTSVTIAAAMTTNILQQVTMDI